MTQQCAVAGLPRETNDGCFDAAKVNKSCVRVHVGQSSEFPIYPTTRERGIKPEIHPGKLVCQSVWTWVHYESTMNQYLNIVPVVSFRSHYILKQFILAVLI